MATLKWPTKTNNSNKNKQKKCMIKPATSSGNLSLKKWEGNALWRVSPVSLSVFTLALSLQTFRLTYARVLDIRQKTCCFLAVHLEPVMSFRQQTHEGNLRDVGLRRYSKFASNRSKNTLFGENAVTQAHYES